MNCLDWLECPSLDCLCSAVWFVSGSHCSALTNGCGQRFQGCADYVCTTDKFLAPVRVGGKESLQLEVQQGHRNRHLLLLCYPSARHVRSSVACVTAGVGLIFDGDNFCICAGPLDRSYINKVCCMSTGKTHKRKRNYNWIGLAREQLVFGVCLLWLLLFCCTLVGGYCSWNKFLRAMAATDPCLMHEGKEAVC